MPMEQPKKVRRRFAPIMSHDELKSMVVLKVSTRDQLRAYKPKVEMSASDIAIIAGGDAVTMTLKVTTNPLNSKDLIERKIGRKLDELCYRLELFDDIQDEIQRRHWKLPPKEEQPEGTSWKPEPKVTRGHPRKLQPDASKEREPA